MSSQVQYSIIVTFTIADLANLDQEQDEDDFNEIEDPSGYEENEANDIMGSQSGGANTKGSINRGSTKDGNIRVAPEDRVAPADRPELEDGEMDDESEQPRETSFPARATIKVEREGKGAMQIEAIASDGEFSINGVYFFPDAELADPSTAEKDWMRRSMYTGPQFGSLDEDLQILLERYLEDRGVNTRMALFIPDYIDYKEQKEYVNWLKSKFPSLPIAPL
jgi:complement component 1 Q subcomponent-binding protein, mitochondrial